MSVENLKAFGAAIAENKAYQQKCKQIGIDDIEGLMAFASELGYDFDVDDAKTLAEEVGITSEELSEEDLEKVAGGAATTTLAVIGIASAVIAGVGAAVSGAASVAHASKYW